jgi:hypothetical protein
MKLGVQRPSHVPSAPVPKLRNEAVVGMRRVYPGQALGPPTIAGPRGRKDDMKPDPLSSAHACA